MTKHTPGPWRITRDHRSPASIEAGDSTAALAKVYLTDPKTRRRTTEFLANAKLIAAAPDLLAAAKFALQVQVGNNTDQDDDAQLLRAAIEKATT